MLDRDPLALALGAVATGLAAVYLLAGLLGARPWIRGGVIGLASVCLVVLPTAVFVAIGATVHRPFGQDGGVVQIPLALDRILAGESPYGADYSDSILGKESRASAFWSAWGGNPILRHHAYLPGTHAVMLPAYLAFRSLGLVFDPRFVTLLAYAIATVLAGRLFSAPSERLTAAALVALNPLVYWHQVFGANDALFIAILLGATLLGRNGRATACGALVGWACATKQLAWPFAPFLILSLSGVVRLRDLLGRDALRRLLRPAAAALLVFLGLLLPVATLDFGAFYRDIVAYNVGLRGDNYPLGGTPGFGFANFLIYFGHISSLRDYFPFSGFYLLLAPVGILLARRQLQRAGAPQALLLGGAALLASLYFSRVVHPNYLMAAAVLIPIGVLTAGAPADVAATPLLLLATAVEVVQSGLFRLTWEQAVEAGILKHVMGLAALLFPRAGAALTTDPLGLGLSALAAAVGVVYLVAGALGASSRLRLVLGFASACLVVLLPMQVFVAIGERTGLRRGQDPWIVQVPADAARLAQWRSPYAEPWDRAPVGREAVSTSFRLEPPRVFEPAQPVFPPGAAVLGLLLRPLGLGDPRWMSALAFVVVAFLGVWLVGRERGPQILSLLAVSPWVFHSTVLGGGVALALAFAMGALAVAARHDWLSGVLAGMGSAVDHRIALLTPFLWTTPGGAGSTARWRALVIGFLLGCGLLVLPVFALDPAGFLAAALRWAAPRPGIGGLALAVGLAAAGVWVWHRSRSAPSHTFALAALFLLLVLFAEREASPSDLWVPAVFLAIAALREPRGS